MKLTNPSDHDPLVIAGRRLSTGVLQSTNSAHIGGPLMSRTFGEESWENEENESVLGTVCYGERIRMIETSGEW